MDRHETVSSDTDTLVLVIRIEMMISVALIEIPICIISIFVQTVAEGDAFTWFYCDKIVTYTDPGILKKLK